MHPATPPTLISHHRQRPLRTALAAAVLAAGCGRSTPPSEARRLPPDGEVRLADDSPQRRSIAVETVQLVNERAIATLPAQVVADEGHTVHITSPVAGRIVSLEAQPGDHVSAGQPLAVVQSADAAQATSDAAKALTAWQAAQVALRRQTDLYAHKVVAARDLEQARSDEAQARAEYARSRARAQQLGLGASSVSDRYTLRAPIDGVVIDRAANPGAEVRPDNAQPLFTITSLGNLWLVVNVPQRDLPEVHRGAILRFTTDAVPDRVFEARVSFVGAALDPVSRMATVRADLPNPGGVLRVQTTGEAQVLAPGGSDAVAVPSRALVTHGTDTVVLVEVSPGRFVRRVVTVRDDDGTIATISAGLAPGDRVVTTGSLLLAADADRTP